MNPKSPRLRNLREIMRDEMVMKDRIAAFLEHGPKTVPEIAAGLGCPGKEVVFWVMAMRRYGKLAERGRPDDEGYFQYELTGGGAP